MADRATGSEGWGVAGTACWWARCLRHQPVDLFLHVRRAPDVFQEVDLLAAAGRAEADFDVAGAEPQEPETQKPMHEDVVALPRGLHLRRRVALGALAEAVFHGDRAGPELPVGETIGTQNDHQPSDQQ